VLQGGTLSLQSLHLFSGAGGNFDGMMKETTLQIHTKPTYFAMHQASVYRPFIQRDFKIRGNGCIHK
jgi:hypothetical protein